VHRRDRVIMPDAKVLRREIESVLRPDRAATDASLREEREQADAAIEKGTDQKLEHTRAIIDSALTAENTPASTPTNHLPEVAETLITASDTLAAAADGLAQAALQLKDIPEGGAVGKLHGALETLDEAAATVVGVPPERQSPVSESRPAAEHAPMVADKLSAVAESLGIVAANLAEERDDVDATLRAERTRVDTTLQAEREIVDEALEEEREAKRRLLEAERTMTDRDLAREREDTDRAVDYTVSLLQEEQISHQRALDLIITRDEYLAIVSHDLRTPLSVISVSATFLADHANDEARVTECTQNISRAAALMNRMLSDLLDATRFAEGRFRLSPRRQNAVEVVRDSAATFGALAHRAGLTLSVDAPSSEVYARFDYDRVLQVLSNLLRNAIHHTPAGGTITLGLQRHERGCRISVSDTGKGIPPQELGRIFERFHQTASSDRRGLGLGLYISKAIIDAHGGCIAASSEPGRGSSFSFTLPA
jgi:signal transduction histidine kinase